MLRRLNDSFVVWSTPGGACGSLSPQVIKLLNGWAQRSFFSKEAGGLILGFIDSDTEGLLAERLTTPGKGDRRSRTSFYRSARHQQEVEIWNRKTAGRGTQIGLWHTHPEADPTPSDVDLVDCSTVLKNGRFDSKGLLYLIVGTRSIGCWYAQQGKPLTHLGHFHP